MELNKDGTIRINKEEERELEEDWKWMFTDLADYIG